MKLRNALVAGAALVMAAACGTATAEHETPAKPTGPTRAEVRLLTDTLNWNNAVLLNETEAWDDATWANQLEALAISYVPPPPPPAPRSPVVPAPSRSTVTNRAPRIDSGGGATGACGGSRFDYVIPKESGGNANARNASGAWGCYQIMPATWSGAGCSGSFGSASPAEQAACADKLSPGAWAASQGG